MIVLGLTGSVGMGKSAVARMLRERGVPVHDADAEVHALLAAGGGAEAAVLARFPSAKSEGGGVDRAVLRGIVFSDAGERKALEGILHPLVRAASDAFVARNRREGAEFCALEIPLLFETGGEGRVDRVLVASAPFAVQKARVLARAGMTEELFARILAGQMPDEEKRARADFVIDTGGAEADTAARVEGILAGLRYS